MTGRIIVGDVLDPATWESIPDRSVHCCVTSPPYWSLRDYGVPGQLGLEKTPEEYVAKMVEAFRVVWRAMRDDGTLWLNIGDSYSSAGRGGGMNGEAGAKQRSNQGALLGPKTPPPGLKPKDLVGIPWMLAFALRADGWYLRQEIIWHKPNPMPESCHDRCTKAHESIFLLTKRGTYFYDQEAIKERSQTDDRRPPHGPGQESIDGRPASGGRRVRSPAGWKTGEGAHGTIHEDGREQEVTYADIPTGANKRSVWTVPTQPYPGAHFAVYPEKLIEPCVLAGTSAKGVCPECGNPWERVIEKERIRTRPGLDSKVYDRTTGEAVDDDTMEKPWRDRAEIGNRDPGRHISVTRTTGWQPTCECRDNRPETAKQRQFANDHGFDDTDIWLPVPATVLDPFFGAGTTAVVAQAYDRDYIGIELNPEYAQQAQDRIDAAANPQTWTQADTPADRPLFPDN